MFLIRYYKLHANTVSKATPTSTSLSPLSLYLGDHLLIAKETAKVLALGPYIKSAEGLPMLDPDTKEKPQNLARDYGDMCLAADGFAQVNDG